MKKITISSLPNINFYTGVDAIDAGEAVENRLYGTHTDYYGDLSLSAGNNLYWSYISNSTFNENNVNYNNIGDIINSTISYLNKFKNNTVDININKNILTFNYDYENDLSNDYENTSLIPSSQLINLLLNVNDMTFNKRRYYGNNIELKEISYARKKYPYNPDNTIYVVNDEESETGTRTYDFSRKFVDYKYNEFSYDVSYIGYVMIEYPKDDGTIGYMETGQTYTGFNTYYTYEISDINDFNNRVNLFFTDNSNRVEQKYSNLKTYFISELDTVLTLSLNTYSLGAKNLYAYFNFNSDYNNWFENTLSVKFNKANLNENDELLSITPYKEDWFNVNVNKIDNICGEDIKINSEHTFTLEDTSKLTEEDVQTFSILNPSYIQTLDLSANTDKLTELNLINNYNKRLNIYEFTNTNWMIESNHNIHFERLIIGNSEKNSSITSIKGINNISTLKEIDITNCNQLSKDFSISKLTYLSEFKAAGSNIKNFVPKANTHFEHIYLPETICTLSLKNVTIDNFNYIPTSELINVTLENVTGNGLNTQEFIKNWVDILDNTLLDEGTPNEISKLKDGIVTNTNLVGINWTDYLVQDLLKFKYLGLNKFSGTIGIKSDINTNGNITRKEYLQLRDTFGDEIMKAGKYTTNSKPIKFEYNLDPNAYKINANVFIIGSVDAEYYEIEEIKQNETDHIFIINDNTGGNSLLDYLENIDTLLLTKNKENFGYEITLENNIYIDNNDKSTLTKSLNYGDIVLYKKNKLIFVYKSTTTIYNYTKLGTFKFTENDANQIKITLQK